MMIQRVRALARTYVGMAVNYAPCARAANGKGRCEHLPCCPTLVLGRKEP